MEAEEWIGRYRLREVLRIEPLGRLVRAEQPELGREVYLYELAPPASLTAQDRARLEHGFAELCRSLARARQPALARPFDVASTSTGTHLLAYEAPETDGYHPLPIDPRALPMTAWLALAEPVCGALEALLAAGVAVGEVPIHALFVAADGRLRLLPAGLGDLPRLCGLPPAYRPAPSPLAAPETASGEPGSPASVVYSVAAWLYAMLSGTGRPPAVSPTVPPPPLWNLNPSVRAGLDDVIQRALRWDPEGRYRHPAELAVALRSFLAPPLLDSDRTLPAVAPTAPARAAIPPKPAVTRWRWQEILQELAPWILFPLAAGWTLGWLVAQLTPPQ